jgi:hypothetical protein
LKRPAHRLRIVFGCARSRLHQLERFDLTENLMTGTIPTEWSTMTAIQILRLSNTLLTGTLPPEWSTMSALVDLDFEGSDFLTGTIPQVSATAIM